MELTIKVKYEQDLRRLKLRNVPTFDQLETVIRNLFTLEQGTSLVLRYQDEDEDMITISSSIELEEALALVSKQNPPILRLHVSLGSAKRQIPQASQSQPKVDESQSAPNFASQIPAILMQNPELLRLFLQYYPVLMNLVQQKIGDCQNLNVDELVKMFGNLGINPSPSDLEQICQQFSSLMQTVKDFAPENPQAKEPENSKKNSSKQEPIMHYGITCDNCDETPIGIRYKCSVCADFDLCEKCEPLGVHTPDHPFLKIARPLLRKSCPYRRPEAQGSGSWRSKGRPSTPSSSASDQILLGRFVSNVTVKDGTHLAPGEKFVKTWRMRNTATVPWPETTRLSFVGGDALAPIESVLVPEVVSPDSEVDISVEMVAPSKSGRYVSYWRLTQPDGTRFGQRIWVDIVVSQDAMQVDAAKLAPQAEAPKLVPVNTPKPDQPVNPLVLKLKELGFSDEARIKALLAENHNDLEATIEALLL